MKQVGQAFLLVGLFCFGMAFGGLYSNETVAAAEHSSNFYKNLSADWQETSNRWQRMHDSLDIKTYKLEKQLVDLDFKYTQMEHAAHMQNKMAYR